MEKSIVQLEAKQLLSNYKITSCPAKSFDEILKNENIELIFVNAKGNSCGIFRIIDGEKKIYVNENMNTGRINFTIGHELGHYFLKHELKDFCVLYDKERNITNEKDPQEIEANWFSACFLMPHFLYTKKYNELANQYKFRKDKAIEIKDSSSNNLHILKNVVSQLSQNFLVSKQAAFYRLKDIKLLKMYDEFDINELYY